MSRQRAAPREPPRLNAFQLHYLNQVIPKYQTGPSFTAYDESLEAAYNWLHNFDQAMKNNADAALLAKTPGKATAKKAKVVAKPPTGGRTLFEIRPENVAAPVVKPSAPAPVAQKTTKPSAAFSLPFANKENSSTPKAAVLSPGPARAVKLSVASIQHSKLPTPVKPAKLASPVKVAAPVPSPAPAQLQEQEDEEEAAVEHSISLEGDEVNDQLPSSPIVVVSHPAPSEFGRSRASSFGDGGQTTDDDGQRTDNERTGFGGKSRPASLFSQMSLASTAATSASEWEGNQAQDEEEDVVEKSETGKEAEKEEENVDDERLSTVKESVCPSAASPKEEGAAPAVEPLVVSIQEAESAVEDAQATMVETPNSQASPEPTVAAAPAAPPKPSRPVRSSWLRSALGAEVGAPAGPGPGGARKSQGAALVAAAREKERERERDIAAASTLATPAAPVRSKRKSEEIEAVDDVDEDDHTTRSALSRSTKIIKLDDRPLPPASSATLPSNQTSSATPFKRAIFSPPAEDNAEDGMSRVRKAMEELSARTKGRGMSTVGLGTLGGSILGNQTLVGRLTMPVGQVAAGTPTFNAAINGPREDAPTPSPGDSESKQLQEISQPVHTEEVTPAPETSAPSAAPVAEPAPVVEAPVASTGQSAAAPAPEERSFEIIDLTQSMNSLPPTPARANAKSPSRKDNNATSSFGSLMGDLEAATTTPSPPPTPPPAAPAKTTKASASTSKTATPHKSASRTVDTSTTPMASPPKKRLSSNDGDLTLEDLEQSIVIDDEEDVRVLMNAPANRLAGKFVPKMKERAGTAEEDDEELIMDVPPPKSTKQQAGVRSREGSAAPSGSNLKQSVSKSTRQDNAGTRLAVSTSSKIAAEKVAGKKPQVDEVKSLQLAAEAAKKEQDAKDRRAAVSKIAEANRHRAAASKAAEEKAKEEEEKRKKMEEVRERKARMAELEKRRKEREAKEKEKRELLAAAKLAEEESKKRKAAPTNGSAPQPKRLQSSVGPSVKVPAGKIATKMGMASSSSTNKVVPSFNHLPPGSKSGASSQAGPSSIRLVGSGMGPPIRTSDMGKTLGPKLGQNNRASQAQGAQVLQAQRQALQSQLSKSQGNQSPHGDRPGESEAIELADIDSEYSDSDDEDRPRSGKDAPPWAQSPEIRNALKQQETHNPDDIFGRMKPIVMDEVFRARAGKFRARTSSANWTNDGVTPQEELAYGKRMGWESK